MSETETIVRRMGILLPGPMPPRQFIDVSFRKYGSQTSTCQVVLEGPEYDFIDHGESIILGRYRKRTTLFTLLTFIRAALLLRQQAVPERGVVNLIPPPRITGLEAVEEHWILVCGLPFH